MDDEALRLEGHAEETADLGFVVDDEDHRRHDPGGPPGTAMLPGREIATVSPPVRLLKAADRPAMRLHDALADGQAETDAPGRGILAPEERFKQVRQVPRIDARAPGRPP